MHKHTHTYAWLIHTYRLAQAHTLPYTQRGRHTHMHRHPPHTHTHTRGTLSYSFLSKSARLFTWYKSSGSDWFWGISPNASDFGSYYIAVVPSTSLLIDINWKRKKGSFKNLEGWGCDSEAEWLPSMGMAGENQGRGRETEEEAKEGEGGKKSLEQFKDLWDVSNTSRWAVKMLSSVCWVSNIFLLLTKALSLFPSYGRCVQGLFNSPQALPISHHHHPLLFTKKFFLTDDPFP